MSATRRDVLSAGAAFGVAGVAAAQPATTASARMPLERFVDDPARVAALRRGFQVMRARAPSDPTSFFYQAAVHSSARDLYMDAVLRDAEVARVDQTRFWNQCPHHGEASANFVVWHRAYVYYFERILRAAAGDPTLALPYWNYQAAGQRAFPAIFAAQWLDEDHSQVNPLWHANREQAFVRGLYELAGPVCEAADTRSATIFFHDGERRGFGGDCLEDETVTGLAESRPHGEVHMAVGGAVGSSTGSMADIPTAAFDPVFWVHHANIDRLWADWSTTPGVSWGPPAPAGWWDASPWSFHDADGSVKSEPRRRWIDHRLLGVRYAGEDLSRPVLRLDALPMVGTSGSPAVATGSPSGPTVDSDAVDRAGRGTGRRGRTGRTDRDPNDRAGFGQGSDRGAGGRSSLGRTARATLRVDDALVIPGEIIASAEQGGRVILDGREATEFAMRLVAWRTSGRPDDRVLLELADVRFQRAPSAGFDVHVNPAGGHPSFMDRSFVGRMTLFGASANSAATTCRPGRAGACSQRFDITSRALAANGRVEVALTPYALLAPRDGAAPLTRPDPLTIGRVRLLLARLAA